MAKLKMFRLGTEELYNLLNRRIMPDVVTVPVEQTLPEGSRIHHIYHDPRNMYVSVVVEHESFDEVEEGEIPRGDDYLRFKHMVIIGADNVGILKDMSLIALKEAKDKITEMIYDKEKRGMRNAD